MLSSYCKRSYRKFHLLVASISFLGFVVVRHGGICSAAGVAVPPAIGKRSALLASSDFHQDDSDIDDGTEMQQLKRKKRNLRTRRRRQLSSKSSYNSPYDVRAPRTVPARNRSGGRYDPTKALSKLDFCFLVLSKRISPSFRSLLTTSLLTPTYFELVLNYTMQTTMLSY